MFFLLLFIAPKNIFWISLTELELSITLKRTRKIKISQLFVVEMVTAVYTSPAKQNFSTSPEQLGIFLWSFDSYDKVFLESFWYSQAWNLKTGISLFLIQHSLLIMFYLIKRISLIFLSFLAWNRSFMPANLLKKRLWHRCFPVNFAKFLRTSFLQNTFGGCFWW